MSKKIKHMQMDALTKTFDGVRDMVVLSVSGVGSLVDNKTRLDLLKNASLRIHEMAWSTNLLYEPNWDAWQPYVKDYFPWFSDHAPYRDSWIDR